MSPGSRTRSVGATSPAPSSSDGRRVLLCITPAPAIDRTAHVERIATDVVLRPTRLLALAGGKGVNAARAASRLGADVITTGIAGGHAGHWMIEQLAAEGLAPHFALADAESRTTYVTVDESGTSVIVYERPAPATRDEYEAFLELLEHELLPRCSRAIVAGSIPTNLPHDGYGLIVEASRRAQRPLLVDASGQGLRSALAAGPDVVKVGRSEVVEAGLVESGATAHEAALALLEAGARLAVVTDGAAPVAAADAGTIWEAQTPAIEAVNAVGSGDAFNAAMSLALASGASIDVALGRGVAAGTANALALGAGMLDADVAHELEERVTVSHTTR